jgi:hypothetical protein
MLHGADTDEVIFCQHANINHQLIPKEGSMRITASTLILSAGLVMPGVTTVAEPIDKTNTLPPAKPGQCYAKVMLPAQYQSKEEKVMVREAAEKIDTIPAKYEWVEQKVTIVQAQTKLVPVPVVYEEVTEKFKVNPSQRLWVTSLDKKSLPASPVLLSAAKSGGVHLDQAESGMCFKEYYQDAQYKTEMKKVLVKEASEVLETIPATYEDVEKKVLVKEASKKIIEIPATYETVTEQVLVEPAKTVWKKGGGVIEKIDNTTGEVMCLVEVPAKYKTIEKQIVKTPATTREEVVPAVYKTVKVKKLVNPAQEKRTKIPAEYEQVAQHIKISDAKFSWVAKHEDTKPAGAPTGNQICLKEIPAKFETVKKQVVKTPATFVKEDVPAVVKNVKVRKLVAKAGEKRTNIPAEFKMVTKRNKISDESLEWRQVLCETNMTKNVIVRLQESLEQAGYKPGIADGVMGGATLRAVDAYQQDKELPRGGLTILTLETLGVKI